MLPAAHRGHHRVAQVILAMGRVLDIGPFELGAATTGRRKTESVTSRCDERKAKTDEKNNLPAALLANTSNKIHDELWSWMKLGRSHGDDTQGGEWAHAIIAVPHPRVADNELVLLDHVQYFCSRLPTTSEHVEVLCHDNSRAPLTCGQLCFFI